MWRAVTFLALFSAFLCALGNVADSPLQAIRYEIAPPPLPASVVDRDASIIVTTKDEHGDALRGARVEVLFDVTELGGKVFRAGGGRSDAKGVTKIARLPRGHAWVIADADGRARASASLVLAPTVAGSERTVELVLGPEHTFVVNVVDTEGHGVANAEIEVAGADALPYGARCDGLGRAEVGRLGEPGASGWVVTARSPGYDDASARGVRDGAAIKLVLHRLGSILVRVVDASDKPVQNAHVRIAGTALWPAREGRTGEHGMVKLAGLFAGSYALRATDGTRASPIEIGVMLASGEDKDLTLRLLPGRMVTAHVTDGDAEDAENISGARVVLAESGLSPFPLEAVTDKRGRATLGPIAAGPSSLSARADGFVGRASVAVPEDASGDVRVVLVRAGVLEGRVVDARGFPIASATIEIVGSDFAGGPIDDDPRRADFRDAEFHATLAGPAQLVPAGELGVVPGPVPPIPRGPISFGPTDPRAQRAPPAEPWVTSSDGTFRATPATPGRVRALVRHPEYVEAWSELVTIPAGGTAHVEVVLHAGGSLEGRVVDAQGRPVAGARIELAAIHGTLQRDTKTATDGTFAFASTPHDVALDVFDSDDETAPVLRTTVAVADGERKEITLTLPASREKVHVRVLDDRGFAVASAEIAIASLDASSPLRETVFSDAAGDAQIQNAQGLPLHVDVTAPGHAPKSMTLDSAPAELEVSLVPGVTSNVVVRDSRGNPLQDAEVVFYMNSSVRHLRTDAKGATSIADVAPGPARVVARASGYANAERSVDVPSSDRPFSLTIDLASEGIVTGEVRDARGDPVAGARVAKDRVPVFLAAGQTPTDVATTDSRGRFKLGALEAGALTLEAYAPDVGRGHAFGVRVAAGRETTNVRIVLGANEDASKTADHAGATVAVTLGETGGDSREVVIVLVAEGSDAERAGLLPNDTLVTVDGAPVHTIEDAREKLSGPANVDVVLGIRRDGSSMRIRAGREMVRR